MSQIAGMQTLPDQEIVVVGGGLVGAAVAWGLARKGLRPLVLDGEDLAHRASRANFALIWVQGKGNGAPHYARWTIGSAKLWPSFAEELTETSGIDVVLRQRGGFTFALSENEMTMWTEEVQSVAATLGEDAPEHVLLDHAGTARMIPAIGNDVVGSIYSPLDGDVNSLRLFRALHAGMINLGARYRAHSDVTEILPKEDGFLLQGAWGQVFASRVVLAAGNGNTRLAPVVGLSAPTLQSKGQILVTEKCAPFFPYTSTTLRQADEGGLMIGDSQEADTSSIATSQDITAVLAHRAIRTFPQLAQVNVLRSWVGFRVKTPDGLPIYETSPTHPGASVVMCHSGVTLAANHALRIAASIAGRETILANGGFSGRRFHVPQH